MLSHYGKVIIVSQKVIKKISTIATGHGRFLPSGTDGERKPEKENAQHHTEVNIPHEH